MLLPKYLYHFASPPPVNESSYWSTSSSVFSVISILDFCHSNRFVVVFCCCFNLHCPDDIWWKAVFQYPYSPSIHFLWWGGGGTSLVAQLVKNLPAVQVTWVQSPGWEDPLEKEMATHSSILAWKISWTEELGVLRSMGLQRVGYYKQLYVS